jgi:hypothetical protein
MLRSLSAPLCLLALTIAVPALAADPTAEDIAAARTLGVQGIQLADAGNCAEAIDKLERAEALYHAPTILGRLGECQVQVGQIVKGTENLNRVVREQLAPNAPAVFKQAQDRAKQQLDAALPRIAYLTVKVEPSAANASVTVDNVAVPAALIGAERPTDPGTHEVVANATGYSQARQSVTLAEGGHQEVTLTLASDASAVASTPLNTNTTTLPEGGAVNLTPAPAPAPAPPQRDNSLAIFALGVGGAGLVVGTVTGVLAISKKNDLECPDKKCPPSQHDNLDSANTMAMISNVGFGVGIVGAAIGTVLLVTGGHKTEAPPPAPATALRLRARPFVSQNSVGLAGTF